MSKRIEGSVKPREGLSEVLKAATTVDALLKRVLRAYAKGSAKEMIGMSEYFLGFKDENLTNRASTSGKRFRPALILFLADAYGVRKKTISAALSIELFHNFTLIHDDVMDKDETRRGRSTVWKIWGNEHAINSGDALLIIASTLAVSAEKESVPGLAQVLFSAYAKVFEGQHLDLEFAKRPLNTISEKEYLHMIARKTGALVALCGEVVGLVAKKGPAARKGLRTFGESLGIAYQIADDYRSVWSSESQTGKDSYGDIRERKRAYPVLCARSRLKGPELTKLAELFDLDRRLTTQEVLNAKALIDAAEVQKDIQKLISQYAEISKKAVRKTGLSLQVRQTLEALVDELVQVD